MTHPTSVVWLSDAYERSASRCDSRLVQLHGNKGVLDGSIDSGAFACIWTLDRADAREAAETKDNASRLLEHHIFDGSDELRYMEVAPAARRAHSKPPAKKLSEISGWGHNNERDRSIGFLLWKKASLTPTPRQELILRSGIIHQFKTCPGSITCSSSPCLHLQHTG